MKYFSVNNDKIVCNICPRTCNLKDGQTGFCRSMINDKGILKNSSYGYSSGFGVDPVEKKPLYHFYPSSKAFSFGTFGCNMGCLFCQNYNISKISPNYSMSVQASPEQIVNTAIHYDCKSIAFTYNDPTVFLEYATDTAIAAHEKHLKTVAVTAGYILEKPREDFYKHIDAVNIDLKAFSSEFYKKYCFADINRVLDTIVYLVKETNCVVEITTLLIDGYNDNDEDLIKEFKWISENLGEDIPLHLSAFHPAYKFSDKKRTQEETIIRAYNLAKNEGLNYVYCGNINNQKMSLTYCPKCGYKLIDRNFYNVNNIGLVNGKCQNCGHDIYGKF